MEEQWKENQKGFVKIAIELTIGRTKMNPSTAVGKSTSNRKHLEEVGDSSYQKWGSEKEVQTREGEEGTFEI